VPAEILQFSQIHIPYFMTMRINEMLGVIEINHQHRRRIFRRCASKLPFQRMLHLTPIEETGQGS
jgi:hypothetical protein